MVLMTELKCLICSRSMQPVFPDAKRDEEACVFQCVYCRIIETITEERPAKQFKHAN